MGKPAELRWKAAADGFQVRGISTGGMYRRRDGEVSGQSCVRPSQISVHGANIKNSLQLQHFHYSGLL
jgi:hypothetical protein